MFSLLMRPKHSKTLGQQGIFRYLDIFTMLQNDATSLPQ